jgi:beta-lactamase regulating signal transducer with metallopeptidase domain
MISLGFHWLVTYLVHSSVLLACAAALDWRRRLTARGMSSALWRIALFGGFISATLQPALQGFFADYQHAMALVSPQDLSVNRFPAAVPSLMAVNTIGIGLLLVPVWIGFASCGAAYLLVRWFRVARKIAQMPVATSSDLERAVFELARRARIPPPRLRVSAHLHAPLVAPGRVICIPAWMLDEYDPARLHAALAHEMAHLRRRDNEWRIVAHFAAMVGWLQPLNRLATRRLDESAELACDAWAATATGLHRELACSLEDCAVRFVSSVQDLAPAIGMAAVRSTLLERVTRLLEDSHMNTDLKHVARWSSAALLAIAVAGLFFVVSTLDDDVPPRWLAANGLYQSLRNIDQDVHVSRSVVVKSPEQYVYIRVTENFSLDPSEPRAGMAVISETREGVTRSVRYERGTHNELRLTYRINGRVHLLDAEGERWLEAMKPIAAPAFSRS